MPLQEFVITACHEYGVTFRGCWMESGRGQSGHGYPADPCFSLQPVHTASMLTELTCQQVS
jgi:hypothetical protein